MSPPGSPADGPSDNQCDLLADVWLPAASIDRVCQRREAVLQCLQEVLEGDIHPSLKAAEPQGIPLPLVASPAWLYAMARLNTASSTGDEIAWGVLNHGSCTWGLDIV